MIKTKNTEKNEEKKESDASSYAKANSYINKKSEYPSA